MGSNPVSGSKSFLFFDALKTASVLVFLFSIALVVIRRTDWLGGVWITAGWIAANAYIMKRLLEDVADRKPFDRRKVQLILLIKFPVLYLTGFLALYLGWARLEGAAAAFTAYFAACAFHVVLNRTRFGK